MTSFETIHSQLVGRLSFPLSSYLYNRKGIARHYRNLLRSQFFCQAALKEIQLRKLKNIVKYAYYFVPYYQRLFNKIKLNPRDIKSLEDIRFIPPLTREELVTHFEELINVRFRTSIPVANRTSREPGEPIPFAKFRKHKLVRNTSSGSTGVPTIFYEDGSISALNWAYELRCKNWYGIQPGEREARMVSLSTKSMPSNKIMRMRKLLWNQLILPGVNLGDEHFEMCLRQIIEFKPKVLWGFTSALVGLAKYIQGKNADLGLYRPSLIIGRAAPLFDHDEKVLREVFDCPVSDIYSAREVGHIAAKCPQGTFHINQENLVVETDSKLFSERDHGQGELLVTTLAPTPMPFIRYRMGDIGEVTESKCVCGRTLLTLSSLLGRTEELFKTKDGRIISPIFWSLTFMDHALAGAISRFQVIYTKGGNIHIKIVRNDNYTLETEVYLTKVIKLNFDPDTKVSYTYVQNIAPKSSGKYQLIKWE